MKLKIRALIAPFLIAVLVGALVWRPTIEVAIDSSQVAKDGSAYAVDLSAMGYPGYRLLSDTERFQLQSNLVLLRNGVPLGPPHTNPVTLPLGINGNGAYSHWNGKLIFSTIGNVDPRTDGHRYSLRAQLSLDTRLAACIGAFLVILLGVLIHGRTALIRTTWKSCSTPAKLIAFGLCMLFIPDVFGEVRSLAASTHYIWLALYVLIFMVAVVGLLVVPFLQDWRTRVPISIALVAGYAADRIISNLYHHNLSFDLVQVLWRERGMAGDVITAYQNQILVGIGIAVPLLVAFAMGPAGRWLADGRMIVFPIIAFVSICLVVAATKGRVQAFPPPFAVPANLFLAQVKAVRLNSAQPRRPVAYNGELHPRVRKIVMVVDESVRGDYLGINNSSYDNTPFLRDNEDRIANYGEAVSSANCSGSARVVLRSGLQRHQLPDLANKWLTMPMIWAYARKAGFKTIMIDAWHQERPNHSYMTPAEEKEMDLQIYPADQPRYLRDMVVADKLVQLLQSDEPALIYVNKFGTHMDYAHSFPPELAYYPAETALPALDQRRRDIIRNYHRAIKFTVDDFLAKVLPTIFADPSAMLIYTSDHGQSMFEGDYDASHCSYNPASVQREFSVPLIVATGSDQLTALFREAARRSFDRAHHFDIFPTMLEMMGYPAKWISTNYAPPLLSERLERERSGLLGTFNLPGAKWIKIELNRNDSMEKTVPLTR